MPFHQAGYLKYYTFSSFENQGLFQAIFTRIGGLSPAPWQSLNFGASVGDDIERVKQNRERALQVLNLGPMSVYDLYQVHSTTVITTDRALSSGETHLKGDAIITRQPGVTLMMRFADCVPVLLFDPVKRVIAIIHAGWIGTVEQIVKKTVLVMGEKFGVRAGDIIAGIGPSIGPDHYVVRNDVINRVKASFGKMADRLLTNQADGVHFDLWSANEMLLNNMGVECVETSRICTACNLMDWYSHRGENGKTGRFGILFGIIN